MVARRSMFPFCLSGSTKTRNSGREAETRSQKTSITKRTSGLIEAGWVWKETQFYLARKVNVRRGIRLLSMAPVIGFGSGDTDFEIEIPTTRVPWQEKGYADL